MSARLSCKAVSKLASESMDRRISISESLEMKMHLVMCKFCWRFKKQILSIRKTMRDNAALMEEADACITLRSEAKDRIRQCLQKGASG